MTCPPRHTNAHGRQPGWVAVLRHHVDNLHASPKKVSAVHMSNYPSAPRPMVAGPSCLQRGGHPTSPPDQSSLLRSESRHSTRQEGLNHGCAQGCLTVRCPTPVQSPPTCRQTPPGLRARRLWRLPSFRALSFVRTRRRPTTPASAACKQKKNKLSTNGIHSCRCRPATAHVRTNVPSGHLRQAEM